MHRPVVYRLEVEPGPVAPKASRSRFTASVRQWGIAIPRPTPVDPVAPAACDLTAPARLIVQLQ